MGGVAGKERGEQPLNAKAPPPTPQGQGEQRRIKNIEKYKKRTKKKKIKKAKLPQRRGTTMVIMHKKKKKSFRKEHHIDVSFHDLLLVTDLTCLSCCRGRRGLTGAREIPERNLGV